MWFEIFENGTAQLYRKESFWCNWVEASQEEIANNH
jgi:hypothetical protein